MTAVLPLSTVMMELLRQYWRWSAVAVMSSSSSTCPPSVPLCTVWTMWTASLDLKCLDWLTKNPGTAKQLHLLSIFKASLEKEQPFPLDITIYRYLWWNKVYEGWNLMTFSAYSKHFISISVFLILWAVWRMQKCAFWLVPAWFYQVCGFLSRMDQCCVFKVCWHHTNRMGFCLETWIELPSSLIQWHLLWSRWSQ